MYKWAQFQELMLKCQKFTNTFCINARLEHDRLSIILIDFYHWTIYQRQYGKQDLGGEINRKVDFEDLIDVFKDHNPNKYLSYSEYIFGTLEKSQNGSPLFIINQNGNIIVFTVLHKKNIQQILKSSLNLFKTRNMNELQILTIKSQIQRRQLLNTLNQQITKLKQQNKQIKEYLSQRQSKQQQLLSYKCNNGLNSVNNVYGYKNKKNGLEKTVHVVV